MPQETDVERIPLLRGPYHNIVYNNNQNNDNNRIFRILGYLFIAVAVLLLSIHVVLYFIESNEQDLPKGTSRLPYEYYLGLKSDSWSGFEYVIETISTSNDSKVPKSFVKEESYSTLNDRIKLAEIVPRNYKGWNPAYYEVRENRNNNTGNDSFTVLTTQSYMSGLWFILWPPKVYVTFASNDDDENRNDDNNGGRETRIIKEDDPEKLLKCEYEISWNYKYFGEIHRKCPNQEKWKKVAYVKGSSEWGMQLLDPERVETYGVVTKPSQKNRQIRNIVIRPDSPFPPILPALYVAYFDRVINRGDSGGRKELSIKS